MRTKQHDDSAKIWIFRGKVAPKTRFDSDVLAAKASDIATASLHAVGADATEAGREIYEAGDRHAIVIGNAPGEVTVCLALVDATLAVAYCSQLTIDDDANPNDAESARVLPVRFKTGSWTCVTPAS